MGKILSVVEENISHVAGTFISFFLIVPAAAAVVVVAAAAVVVDAVVVDVAPADVETRLVFPFKDASSAKNLNFFKSKRKNFSF